jgi:ribosomal-protein-alanine N-acetyltransferase
MSVRASTSLRVLGPEHAPVLLKLLSNSTVAQSYWACSTDRVIHEQEWIDDRITARARHVGISFAVIAEIGEVVGLCSFNYIQDCSKSALLSYWIGEPYWNKGYASAGTEQALDYALLHLPVRRVFSFVLETNPQSRRVLENLGFELVGRQAQMISGLDSNLRVCQYRFDLMRST